MSKNSKDSPLRFPKVLQIVQKSKNIQFTALQFFSALILCVYIWPEYIQPNDKTDPEMQSAPPIL